MNPYEQTQAALSARAARLVSIGASMGGEEEKGVPLYWTILPALVVVGLFVHLLSGKGLAR